MAEDLWKIRKRKGLTVQQLASKSGVQATMIQDYEAGRRSIRTSDLAKLARALYVDEWDIKELSEPIPAGQRDAAPGEGPRDAAPTREVLREPPREAPPREREVPRIPPREVVREPRPPAPPREIPEAREATREIPREAPREPHVERRPPPPPVAMPERARRPEPPPSVPPPVRRDRAKKEPPPPRPARPTQIDHLLALASKFGVDRAGLEAQTGKPMDQLTMPEVRKWLGEYTRRIIEERPTKTAAAPNIERHRAYLPEGVDGFELDYLTRQQQDQARIRFTLFDGQVKEGQVVGFGPYNITIQQDDGTELTLNKLAIAYYQRLSPAGPADHTDQGESAQVEPMETAVGATL